jgi:putative Holliday junction resolvase
VRILGLDIGEKRIGVAVSDPSGTVATPLAVIDARKALGDGSELSRLAADYEAELLVAGLPLSLDGSEGPQAARVRTAAKRLAVLVSLPLEFADERLSSASARRTMTEAGVSDRDKRGSIDMVAAAIFLQSYLDARRETGSKPRRSLESADE